MSVEEPIEVATQGSFQQEVHELLILNYSSNYRSKSEKEDVSHIELM